MPIYEYRCKECGEEFEKLVRSLNRLPEIVCPNCQGKQVQRLVSALASSTSGKGGGEAEEASVTVSDRPPVFGRKELQAAQEKKARLREQARYGDD